MSNKTGFTTDFKAFDKSFFPLVNNAIPGAAEKGVFQAANEMLRDGDKQLPYSPRSEHGGDLRGSRKVEKVKVTRNHISVDAGYNVHYAAKLHEMSEEQDENTNWTVPGSGRKWLETPMATNKVKYIKIIVHVIDQARGPHV